MAEDYNKDQEQNYEASHRPETYYTSVAYFQSTDDTESFDRMKERGDYTGILQEASYYDEGIAPDLSETFKKPCNYRGDDVLIEDDQYAVVYNASVGGTYDIMRKVTKEEILDNIREYGLDSDATEDVKKANIKATVDREQQMGWTVLRNDNRVIRRNADSLVIAGEENGGRKPSPKLADLEKSLHGVCKGAFIVMLQHDPNVWQEKIVPDGRVQLTLSGHTHAGQVSVFGLRFTQLTAHNDYGLYNQGRQQLYVTSGLGGVVAMRFGATAEIAVITLHKTK